MPQPPPHLVQVIYSQLSNNSTLIISVNSLEWNPSCRELALTQFTEPEFSLPCLKQPFPCTHHEPDESNLHLCPVSVRSILISSLYVQFFKMTSFPLVFSGNRVHFRFSMYVTCPAHLSSCIWNLGNFRIFSFSSYKDYGFYNFLPSVNLLSGIVVNLM